MTGDISLLAVSEQYRVLRYYEGVVELALCTSNQVDPQNMAILFYKSGQSPEDALGQEALHKRYDKGKHVL